MKSILPTLRSIRNVKQILPAFLAIVSGHPRYLPEIEWSQKSWTHNIFRVYELLFWRRYGIRAEETTICEIVDGRKRITHQYHSFESVCAGLETWIRDFKLVPFKIYVPALATPFGMPSPYLFAIALDAETDATTSTSFAKTCTGSNLILMAGVLKIPAAGMTVSYSSVALSLIATATNASTESVQMHDLVNPATGSNNVTNTVTPNATYATSYTGAKQSSQPDASATAQPTATTVTLALTSILANCWGVAIVRSDTAPVGVTSGPISTPRGTSSTQTWRDTNVSVAAGSQSTVYNDGGSSCGWCVVGASIAPLSVAPIITANGGSLLLMGVGN